jgi:hypothetical protein
MAECAGGNVDGWVGACLLAGRFDFWPGASTGSSADGDPADMGEGAPDDIVTLLSKKSILMTNSNHQSVMSSNHVFHSLVARALCRPALPCSRWVVGGCWGAEKGICGWCHTVHRSVIRPTLQPCRGRRKRRRPSSTRWGGCRNRAWSSCMRHKTVNSPPPLPRTLPHDHTHDLGWFGLPASRRDAISAGVILGHGSSRTTLEKSTTKPHAHLQHNTPPLSHSNSSWWITHICICFLVGGVRTGCTGLCLRVLMMFAGCLRGVTST